MSGRADTWRARNKAIASDTTWRASAACRGMGPEVFYDDDRILEAFAVCDRCPVRLECSATAAHAREHHGVWGGKRRNPTRRPGQTAAHQRRREEEAETITAGVLALVERLAHDTGRLASLTVPDAPGAP